MRQTIHSALLVAAVLISADKELFGQTAHASAPSEPALSKVVGTGPTSSPQPDPQLELARSFLDKGKIDLADHTVRQYLVQHPRAADAHFLLGYILFKASKPNESLLEYTEAAKFRDPLAFDLKVVALDYALLGDYVDADLWLTRSVQWDRTDAQGWYYLGRTKYNESRPEEAIRAFLRCLELDPKNVKAQYNLGLSYEGLGRLEEAFAAYRQAIAFQAQALNQDPGPMIELGRLLLEHDQPEEAVSYLVQAVAVGPQESRAHEELGRAYSRLNRLVEAASELEKAVALSPESASLHFMLGQVYRKRGMTGSAKFELERSAALNGPKTTSAPSPLQ